MAISNDLEYRAFQMRTVEDEKMIVEGYAAIFESPTVLYRANGIEYKEVIDGRAFSTTEMTDIVMNFNHNGKPVA